MRLPILAVLLLIPFSAAAADSIVKPTSGMRVISTQKTYDTLLADLKAAVKDNKMGVVTEAGPTATAEKRGEIIPGNRIVGVFRNDFAVTIIRAAPAAMIEAPVRFMVTEEPDGTASLAYKEPSAVFKPYMPEGGAALSEAAGSLNTIFEQIAEDATK